MAKAVLGPFTGEEKVSDEVLKVLGGKDIVEFVGFNIIASIDDV